MSSITSIKSLLVPSKLVEVEYPGLPDFKVKLSFLSRESLVSIRKKATKTTYKNRQSAEDFDEELFLKLYVQSSIKGWSGLTLGYLEQLAPIDTKDQDLSSIVEYSEDNALALMKASSDFDSFISGQVTELGNFSTSNTKS